MYRLALLCSLVVATLVPALGAQVPAGTISGTVSDQFGAVLPNAAVTITNRDTGAAGTLTPAGQAGVVANQRYPRITLPADYQLGDVFSSQDLRLSKTIRVRNDIEVRLIGEVFNLFNVSNLTNFNYNLVVPATFGKANQRVGQTFGTGGPRAFQLAARLSF